MFSHHYCNTTIIIIIMIPKTPGRSRRMTWTSACERPRPWKESLGNPNSAQSHEFGEKVTTGEMELWKMRKLKQQWVFNIFQLYHQNTSWTPVRLASTEFSNMLTQNLSSLPPVSLFSTPEPTVSGCFTRHLDGGHQLQHGRMPGVLPMVTTGDPPFFQKDPY